VLSGVMSAAAEALACLSVHQTHRRGSECQLIRKRTEIHNSLTIRRVREGNNMLKNGIRSLTFASHFFVIGCYVSQCYDAVGWVM